MWGKVLFTTGTLVSSLGALNPFRYRGYLYDVETGFYYLRSRYYNPNWNRFANADVCMVRAKPNGQNLYCYSYNSPICRKDENGYLPFDPFPNLLDAIDDFYNNYGNQDYEFGTIFMRNRDNPEIYYYREPVQGTTSSVQPHLAIPPLEEFRENEIIAYAHTHSKFIDDYGVYIPSLVDVEYARKLNPLLTITPDSNIYSIYIHHMDGTTPIMHVEVLRGPKELVQFGNDFDYIDFFVIMLNYLDSISFEGG